MSKNETNPLYFPHDGNAHNSKKLIPLRRKYGMAGYGIYFILIERMRVEPNYCLPSNLEDLAFTLQLTEMETEILGHVVNDFGLFEYTDDGEEFYSPGFLARMSFKDAKNPKYEARARKAANARWGMKETDDIDAEEDECVDVDDDACDAYDAKHDACDAYDAKHTSKHSKHNACDAYDAKHSKHNAWMLTMLKEKKGKEIKQKERETRAPARIYVGQARPSPSSSTQKQEQTTESPPKSRGEEARTGEVRPKTGEVAEIIEYLNVKAGAQFSPESTVTQRSIQSLLARGHTMDELKRVVDKQCQLWKQDAKMAGYLRPKTLFGANFENYLAAPEATSPRKKRGTANVDRDERVTDEERKQWLAEKMRRDREDASAWMPQ